GPVPLQPGDRAAAHRGGHHELLLRGLFADDPEQVVVLLHRGTDQDLLRGPLGLGGVVEVVGEQPLHRFADLPVDLAGRRDVDQRLVRRRPQVAQPVVLVAEPAGQSGAHHGSDQQGGDERFPPASRCGPVFPVLDFAFFGTVRRGVPVVRLALRGGLRAGSSARGPVGFRPVRFFAVVRSFTPVVAGGFRLGLSGTAALVAFDGAVRFSAFVRGRLLRTGGVVGGFSAATGGRLLRRFGFPRGAVRFDLDGGQSGGLVFGGGSRIGVPGSARRLLALDRGCLFALAQPGNPRPPGRNPAVGLRAAGTGHDSYSSGLLVVSRRARYRWR